MTLVASSIGHANPLNVAVTNSETLKTDVTALSNEVTRLKEMLQLMLAKEAAQQRANAYEGDAGKAEAKKKVESAESVEKVQKAVNILADNKLDKSLGKELRENLHKCAQEIQAGKANFPGSTGNDASECTTDKVSGLLEELKKQREQSLEAWKACRETLIKTGKVLPSKIPADPTGIDRKEAKDKFVPTLKSIGEDVKSLGGEVAKCSNSIESLYKDISNQEDAGAAMAMMLNTAAQLCMATGGNPYACGAIFLVAILASLFGSGSGDGDGDGKSDGTGEEGNGTPGTGVGVSPKPSPTPAPEQNKIEDPLVDPNNPADGDNLTGDPNGPWGCKVTDKELSCTVVKAQAGAPSVGTKFSISTDPSRLVVPPITEFEKASLRVFSAFLKTKKNKIDLCGESVEGIPVTGFVVNDGGNYYEIGLAAGPDSEQEKKKKDYKLMIQTDEDGKAKPFAGSSETKRCEAFGG